MILNESDAGSTEVLTAKRSRSTFVRKYDPSYLKFGFIAADEAGVQKPQCVVCGVVLSNDSMKPSNLKRRLHSKHKDYSSKPKEFFERKRSELKSAQKQMYSLAHVNTKALRASYKVALRIAKAQKPYSIGETLVKGCIQDVCLEVLGELQQLQRLQKFLFQTTLLLDELLIWLIIWKFN